MRIRHFSLLLVLGGSLLALGPAATGASAKPTCEGYEATVVMKSAGTLVNNDNFAVIVGTSGDDTIVANGDSVIVCGGAGNDQITAENGFNDVDGGSGNDTITIDGLSTAIGGSGNDTITGGYSVVVDGGSGDDAITAGPDPLDVKGGSGNDAITVTGSGAPASVDCGSNADSLAYAVTAPKAKRCEFVAQLP